jgi:hypothetical protein
MPKARSSSVINVLIAGDTKKFKKALGRAGSSLADFSKKVGQIGVATGVAMAGIGAKAVDLAVDFEESLSKAKQIFGESAKGIETAAKGAATSVGMSQAEFLEAASSFGVFGKAAGLGGTELSTFADELVTVAADVASFNNLRPEEALEKLQAGLRGSNEPLQSIGVLINATAVKAKALEMGLADANGEISEGSKIMARQALILEKLGEQGALGDFERTSGGLANQMRILKARFKNVGIEIGRKLLPLAMKAVKIIDRMIDVGKNVVKMFGQKGFKGTIVALGKSLVKLWPTIRKVIATIAKKVAKALVSVGKAFVEWIKPRIRPMLRQLLEWAQAAGNWILNTGLPFIAEKIGVFAAAFLEWIGPLVKKLLVNLPTIVATIVKWLATDGIPKIVAAGGKLAEKLVPALLDFGKLFLEGIGSIIAQVGGAIGRGFANMGSYGLDQAGKFGNKILDAIMKPINFVGDMVGAALDGVVTAFKATWNAIAGVWNASIGKFEVKIPGWVPKWGGKGWEMPDLPKFADGGIVTGPTVGLIGEAGPEAVIPLSKMGAMGTTNITINMPAGADGNDVVLALQNYVRQHGSIPLATNNLVRV